MELFIFNLKGIVVIILMCEFMKNLLTTEKFAKYINIAVSVFIIGFIITSIKGTTFDYDPNYSFNYSQGTISENGLKEQYEKQICDKIKAKLDEKNIAIISIEVAADEEYQIEELKIKTSENKEKIEILLEGLGIENYEVALDNQ